MTEWCHGNYLGNGWTKTLLSVSIVILVFVGGLSGNLLTSLSLLLSMS